MCLCILKSLCNLLNIYFLHQLLNHCQDLEVCVKALKSLRKVSSNNFISIALINFLDSDLKDFDVVLNKLLCKNKRVKAQLNVFLQSIDFKIFDNQDIIVFIVRCAFIIPTGCLRVILLWYLLIFLF